MKAQALTILLLLSLFSVGVWAQGHWYQADWSAMTTNVQLEVWVDQESTGLAFENAIRQEFQRIDNLMSRYKENSEVSSLNKLAAEKPVKVSPELLQIIRKSNQVSELTQGAFDITYASVGRFYDYRKKLAPKSSVIDEHIDAINYRHIKVDLSEGHISFDHPHVYIDLGGIAKGYAVDRGIQILKDYGIKHAMLSAGGDTRLLGDKFGRPWVVAVKNPRYSNNDENERAPNTSKQNVVVLPLENVAISTSGDYERYFVQDGERLHHIISPKTGRSAKGLTGVTILGPDTTTTDALSTAAFVLGLKQGMKLVNRLPGIDAVMIDDKGELYYSADLAPPKTKKE